MTNNQVNYCHDVYKDVIEKQILDTKKIRQAANLILGNSDDTLLSIQKAKQVIWSWYNNNFRINNVEDIPSIVKERSNDEKEIINNTPSNDNDKNVNYKGIEINYEKEIESLTSKLNDIESLSPEQVTSELKTLKRSLKIRIGLLKKKLQENG